VPVEAQPAEAEADGSQDEPGKHPQIQEGDVEKGKTYLIHQREHRHDGNERHSKPNENSKH
jgi:hypothetical protein